MKTAFVVAALLAAVCAHDGLPINPDLGVPGFPHCVQTDPTSATPELTLECHQQRTPATQYTIACVGDSITAGVHSSGGDHPYPQQLQILLGDSYAVTNLGACGSTMMKSANSPYWQRPQFKTLTENKWDMVIIMLGTNDAKDAGSGGPPNWPHNCTGAGAATCPYARDYASMIDLVRSLGTSAAGPDVYVAIPPPLYKDTVYGMNGTVINHVLPTLVPIIAKDNKITNTPIDVFDAMGGTMLSQFPPGGCTLNTSTVADCRYFCDAQSCDQCHPNDVGYAFMATVMQAAIGK